jgi:hypothetical protein
MTWILEVVLLIVRSFLFLLQILIHKLLLRRFLNLLKHKVFTCLHPHHEIVEHTEEAIIFLQKLNNLLLVNFIGPNQNVVQKTKSFVT